VASKKPTKLRVAIAESGITQGEVARRAGLSEVAMSRIVNGHRSPDDPTRQQIAAALGQQVCDLWPDTPSDVAQEAA
jgi:transcriptional regulator with XRE-family HTH domain